MKAKFHNNKSIEAELMKAHFVSEVKKIAQRIAVTADWIDQRVEIMRTILRIKADQCQTYRKKLLSCKGHIVEAIKGDLFWSAGLDEKDLKDVPRESWPGQNVLGQLHMELRDELQDFLRGQSQSKKRSIEYKEFTGEKRQKPQPTTPELPQGVEFQSISPEFNLDTALLSTMFNTPMSSPVKSEETKPDDLFQEVTAEIDRMMQESTPEKAIKGKIVNLSSFYDEVLLVFTVEGLVTQENVL